MSIKNRSDIFTKRVAETIAKFKKDNDDATAEFLKCAKINPTWAVERRGESLVIQKEAYKVIDNVRPYLDQVGVVYATRRHAVRACLNYWRDVLIQKRRLKLLSSSAFQNGVDSAGRLGIARAVPVLERLVEDEFI